MQRSGVQGGLEEWEVFLRVTHTQRTRTHLQIVLGGKNVKSLCSQVSLPEDPRPQTQPH
jgi:hypothetical protein